MICVYFDVVCFLAGGKDLVLKLKGWFSGVVVERGLV